MTNNETVIKASGLRRHLVIMLKAPQMGRAKTRLAAEIGTVSAIRLYRAMTRRLITRLHAPQQWHLWLAVAPDEFVADTAWLPQDVLGNTQVVTQGRGDLGARMWRFLSQLPGQRIVVGSDIVGIERGIMTNAFHALAATDYVIGPSDDGGYWLLGAGGTRTRRRSSGANLAAGPLTGVRWLCTHTRRDTIRNLERDGSAVTLLSTLDDVDNGEDLRAAPTAGRHCPGRLVGASPSVHATTHQLG